MPGFTVHVLRGAQQLSVVSPANFWLLLTVGTISALILFNIVRARPFPVVRFAIWSVLIFLIFAFLLESAKMTLNRETQQATISRFAFYHWTTQTLPLANVDHAYLHTGAVSSRIVLQFTDGHTMSLSSNDQMDGKPEAVLAINHFLGRQ